MNIKLNGFKIKIININRMSKKEDSMVFMNNLNKQTSNNPEHLTYSKERKLQLAYDSAYSSIFYSYQYDQNKISYIIERDISFNNLGEKVLTEEEIAKAIIKGVNAATTKLNETYLISQNKKKPKLRLIAYNIDLEIALSRELEKNMPSNSNTINQTTLNLRNLLIEKLQKRK